MSESAMEGIETKTYPTKVENKKFIVETIKENHENTKAYIKQLLPKFHDSIVATIEKIVKENLKDMEININDQAASIIKIAEKLDEIVTNKSLEELTLGGTPEPENQIDQNENQNGRNENGGQRGTRKFNYYNRGHNRERARYFYAARQEKRQSGHCHCHQHNHRGNNSGKRFRPRGGHHH
uniref:Uncharacterized protein n=1 Tax=Meloidogyne javanica TaxID=6303 RepID=A0A915NE26_MELJA